MTDLQSKWDLLQRSLHRWGDSYTEIHGFLETSQAQVEGELGAVVVRTVDQNLKANADSTLFMMNAMHGLSSALADYMEDIPVDYEDTLDRMRELQGVAEGISNDQIRHDALKSVYEIASSDLKAASIASGVNERIATHHFQASCVLAAVALFRMSQIASLVDDDALRRLRDATGPVATLYPPIGVSTVVINFLRHLDQWLKGEALHVTNLNQGLAEWNKLNEAIGELNIFAVNVTALFDRTTQLLNDTK